MAPLTVEDLLPLEVYAPRRREFFDAHRRYVDRCRRVRIGPFLTLVFENRQTLWFRVQEIVRVARLSARDDVEAELRLYNRLLPAAGRLQAALLLDRDADPHATADWSHWRDLDGASLALVVGVRTVSANLVTCRPQDHVVGAAHWVQFDLDALDRAALADERGAAHFRYTDGRLAWTSAPLPPDLRRSLLDDLA